MGFIELLYWLILIFWLIGGIAWNRANRDYVFWSGFGINWVMFLLIGLTIFGLPTGGHVTK